MIQEIKEAVSESRSGNGEISQSGGVEVRHTEPITLSKHEILRRMKEASTMIRRAASLNEVSQMSKEMLILVNCLDAPGKCSYDTETSQYILPGDDILARDISNEQLTNRQILAIMWRLNLQRGLTDNAEETAEINKKMLDFSSRLKLA